MNDLHVNARHGPASSAEPTAEPGTGHQGRRHRLIVLAASLALCLPSLFTGLHTDDYLHRAVLEDRVPDYERGPFELYDFVRSGSEHLDTYRERGMLPWWSSEELHIRFFRPVSSGTLALDHALFGRSGVAAHIHTTIYFTLTSMVVLALFSLLFTRRVALWAALLYVVAGCHSMSLAWVAARHGNLCALFGFLALLCHLHWRIRGWSPGRVLALLALLIGMLCGEAILAAVALLFFYELLGAPAGTSIGERLRAFVPIGALSCGYLLFYVLSDYGARGSGLYLHPLSDPGGFALAALTRIPALVADALSGVPSILHGVNPQTGVLMAVLGVLSAGAALWLLATVRDALEDTSRRHLRWLTVGAAAALVPMSSGLVGGRLLAIPVLGAAAVMACLATRVWAHTRDRSGWQRRGPRLIAGALLASNIGLGALMHVAVPLFYRHLGAQQWRIAAESELGCSPEAHVVLVAAADPSVVTYAPVAMILQERNASASSFRVLSIAPQDHRLTTLDSHSFRLEVVGARRMNGFEPLYRVEPVPVGFTYRGSILSVEVLAATELGPSDVHVRFAERLDSPALCFIEWRDQLLRPLELPEPGGERLLRHQIGPTGL